MKTNRKLQIGLISCVLLVLAVIEVAFLVENYDGTKRALAMDAHREFRLQIANKKDSLLKAGGIDLLLKELSGVMDSSLNHITHGNAQKGYFEVARSKSGGISIRKDVIRLDTNIHNSIDLWVNLEKMDSSLAIIDSVNTVSTIKFETHNEDTVVEFDFGQIKLGEGGSTFWNKRKPTYKSKPSIVLKAMIPQIITAIFLWLLLASILVYGFKSIQKSKKLLALKDDFVATFSHELKTPVAAVKIALESIVKQPDLSKQSTEYINHSQGELLRLERLLEKVMDASKLGAGKPELFLSNVLISEVLTELTNYFTPLAELEKQQLKLSTKAEVEIKTDVNLVKAVLGNIIENAVKYNQGSIVNIFTNVGDKKVVVTIESTGLEIPKEYQSQIFERYFRVPNGNVHNVKGHGLGLYFAKTISTYLHAELKYNYRDGKNCFILSIPTK